MKLKFRYIAMITSMLPFVGASAQASAEPKFAVRATADIGLGTAISIGRGLPEISTKTSGNDFGVEFGWVFWRKMQHSVEANIGLGYRMLSVKTDMAAMKYNYSAPAAADMDNDTYIRYYELGNMHQRISTAQLLIPIYANYTYQINERIGVHALLGFKLGCGTSAKVKKASVSAFSYGVYPQYDNLMIDAAYMNEFGESQLSTAHALKPKCNSVTASFMGGVGAEIGIWGPISADLSFQYEIGASNIFKESPGRIAEFNAENVPVSYIVADGQTMKPLTRYFTRSKMSKPSCKIAVIYRF